MRVPNNHPIACHRLYDARDVGQHLVRFGATRAVIDDENRFHDPNILSKTWSANSTLPNGADTCAPCTDGRTRSSISRAIAIPSATACSFDFSFARRIRVMISDGTVTP